MLIDSNFLKVCAILAMSSLVACVASDDDRIIEDLEAMVEDEIDEDEDQEDKSESEPDPVDEDEGEAEESIPRIPANHEGDCPVPGDLVDCYENGELGTQWCVAGTWGGCVLEPECEPGDVVTEECGFGELTDLECVFEYGVPVWEVCGFTPLVLSFDGREPTFDAGAEAFELSDGSNTCLAREWPGADTPWLAIDLDHSGAIENGRELFGSASPMADGRRPADGFEALSELDSDHDGRITPGDEAWGSLLLWSDLDRDRASSAWELLPLEYSGITAIEIEHTIDRQCDERGNCGIERSTFAFDSAAGGPSTGRSSTCTFPVTDRVALDFTRPKKWNPRGSISGGGYPRSAMASSMKICGRL